MQMNDPRDLRGPREHTVAALEASSAALIALRSIHATMLDAELGDSSQHHQLTLAIDSLAEAIADLRDALGPDTSALALGFVAEHPESASGSRPRTAQPRPRRTA
jgi:hypothetical protein